MMRARVEAILIAVIIIGCSHQRSMSSKMNHPRMATLLKITPNQSTEQDVTRLLGEPAKVYAAENSDELVMEFDLISHPKHKFEFPMTIVFIQKKSRIVRGYNFYPYDGVKLSMADIHTAFPNAKFQNEPIDRTNQHSIPATQILRDKSAGIRVEYRKSDDTVFGYFVSVSEKPSERIPATK